MSWAKLPRPHWELPHRWHKHKVSVRDGLLFSRVAPGEPARVIAVYTQHAAATAATSAELTPPASGTSADSQDERANHYAPDESVKTDSRDSQPAVSASSTEEQTAAITTTDPVSAQGLEVPPPAGTVARNHCWVPLDLGASGQLGCFSFIGPETVVKEGKTNQDFAFCLEICDAAGTPWLLCGVADGVTNAAWQVRGAQQAAAAFITTIGAQLGAQPSPATRLDTPAGQQRFARAFTQEIVTRLQRDRAWLENGRLVPPESKNREFFLSYYFNPEVGVERRQTKWFLSTLLAAAIGPHGGFALLIGDGVLRIDRQRNGEWDRQLLTLPLQQAAGAAPARGPATVVSAALTEGTVQDALYPLLPQDADSLAVLFSTDGLLKTSENQLDTVDPQSSEDCEHFIRELCTRPQGRVYPDNLSMAFCRRRVSA